MVSRGGIASVVAHTAVLAVVALNRGRSVVQGPPTHQAVIDPPVVVLTSESGSAGARSGVTVVPAPQIPWSKKPTTLGEVLPVRPGWQPVSCDTACVRRLTESQIEPMSPVAEGVTGPELERPVLPEYPAALAARGVSGRATIEFTVGPDGGMVPGSAVTVAADDPRFAESAMAAAAAERFRPGRRGPAKVSTRVRQTFVFNVR